MEKERKEEILDLITKAGDSDNYQVKWNDEGVPSVKSKEKIAMGKKSKKGGLDFESKVRADLEEKGWVVCKWVNNIDLVQHKIIPAKRKFNPFSKIMTLGTGFPDFIAFRKNGDLYSVWGVEVKTNGQLDREEKEKCAFLLENNIFSEVVVARKSKDEKTIEYVFFKEKYLKEDD